jgi:hypothetical protein
MSAKMSEDLREYISGLDIHEVRLISGEHILAEIIFQSDDEYSIKDPILVERDVGNTRTAFIEWFPYAAEQYMSIDKAHIICSTEVDLHSKIHFCRMATANKVRRVSIAGGNPDHEDIELFRELLGAEVQINSESHPQDDEWLDAVDTSTLH